MRNLLFVILLFCGSVKGFSQKNYYIYLQSEQRQAFYATLNGKTYSSSPAGYAILPNLQDTVYQVTIGFPQNNAPVQQYYLGVNKKDGGYLIKNFGENGWGLFDLQTLTVTMSNNSAPAKTAVAVAQQAVTQQQNVTKKTDAFSTMLSDAVNDSSILYNNNKPKEVAVVKQAAPKEVQAPVAAVESTIATTTAAATETATTAAKVATEAVVATAPVLNVTQQVAKEDVAMSTPPPPPVEEKQVPPAVTEVPSAPQNGIRKVSENRTDNYIYKMFFSTTGTVVDTIIIAIPLDKTEPAQATAATTTVSQAATTVASTTVAAIPNSDCKAVATDSDIDKLRVKLLSAADNDEKISLCKKFFKTKCVTTKNLRGLSELYNDDEDKYMLLDAAYPYAYDTYNYTSLKDLLKSDYYINRFNALIQH